MSCRFIQLECSLGEWGWAYFACQIDREYSKFIYNFDNVEKKTIHNKQIYRGQTKDSSARRRYTANLFESRTMIQYEFSSALKILFFLRTILFRSMSVPCTLTVWLGSQSLGTAEFSPASLRARMQRFNVCSPELAGKYPMLAILQPLRTGASFFVDGLINISVPRSAALR